MSMSLIKKMTDMKKIYILSLIALLCTSIFSNAQSLFVQYNFLNQ